MRPDLFARHFGLRREAFALSPDPHFLFASPDHAEALAGLEVGLLTRRGLMVVVAEVGMGKTTLLHALLARLGDDVRTAYLTNTRLSFDDLLRQALDDFGVEPAGGDRYSLVSALNGFLSRCAEDGTIPALVIDEAHDLDDETFENLRLLSNFDTFDKKLLQIVLVGQPELDDKLRQPNLRQIAERVATRVNVNPLDHRRSIAYVKHRLARAGGTIDLFTRPALEYVIYRARGVPRRINILCHNAMLAAWASGAPRVGLPAVLSAERERNGGSLVRLTGRRRRMPRFAVLAGAGLAGLGTLALLPHAPVAPALPMAAGIGIGPAGTSSLVDAADVLAMPVAMAAIPAHDGPGSGADGAATASLGRAERPAKGRLAAAIIGEPAPPKRRKAPRAAFVGPPAPARRAAAGARSGRVVADGPRRGPENVARDATRRSRSGDGRRASAMAIEKPALVCFIDHRQGCGVQA